MHWFDEQNPDDAVEADRAAQEAQTVLDVVLPYWDTSFVAQQKQGNMTPPFYSSDMTGTKYISAFDQWMANWVRYLMFCAEGSQVRGTPMGVRSTTLERLRAHAACAVPSSTPVGHLLCLPRCAQA